MRTSQEKYFSIIEKFMSSGLSAKAFSERNRINKNTLSYWKKRYRDQSKVQQKDLPLYPLPRYSQSRLALNMPMVHGWSLVMLLMRQYSGHSFLFSNHDWI
ncbi:MAG: hypothetical protein IPG01_10495 [Chitinophagaceae bacterium]|nr:hypothetical protein [Chitinophagaceae bacterium]